jgi:selenide,water dikinase
MIKKLNPLPEGPVKLTQYAHGAGCGCKISPQILEVILKGNLATAHPGLLIGNDHQDDAAVFELNEKEALISTTDFFMPVVDDPFIFGQIAAANALSDVYAMGGKPIMALAILGWPVDKLSPEIARQVIEGARKICAEANIPLAGGHSIDSPEPIFGLSVNGLVNIQQLKKNSGAKTGDLIFLTKSLGTGILTTAAKRGLLNKEYEPGLLKQMTTLNKIGEELGRIEGVHALTDVTGFGILGHLTEMAKGSNLTAEIEFNKIQLLPGVDECIAQQILPDASFRNWNSYKSTTYIEDTVPSLKAFQVLPDPQTNGGLLIAVSPGAVQQVQNLLAKNEYSMHVEPIGRFINQTSFSVVVK